MIEEDDKVFAFNENVADRKRTIFKVLSRIFLLLIIVSIKLRREVVLGFDIAFSFTLLFPTTLGRWLRTTVTLILQVADAGVTSTLLLRERERTFSAMGGRRSKETPCSLIQRTVIQPSRCVNLAIVYRGKGWGRKEKKTGIKELKVVQSARDTPSKQEKFPVYSLSSSELVETIQLFRENLRNSKFRRGLLKRFILISLTLNTTMIEEIKEDAFEIVIYD